MGATAQINVKLDAGLKNTGDVALAEIGLSASQVIRDLWQAVSKRGEKRQRVVTAIAESARDDEMSPGQAARIAAAERGSTIFEDKLRALGLDPTGFTPLSDEEIARSRYEHLMSKGQK